ncbi:helix-turn-helix domain-containing protein [Xanthocytophaga flava]|uniref:helix-turn-helix domain-containing protein n=1 Tax=Xanthocytophaga flava TaxID=3048013 RepID=UPI0028D46524|nr:helix-turn-helix domain-containing protein [Xanthocytophaga flavus]MDJ1468197.1 helix-turn-helix domain-containing protein [Xanthocytophaga flavus]
MNVDIEVPMFMRIKQLRKQLNLTQEEFATSIGTSRSNYSQFETGKSNLTPDSIAKLSLKYQVNANWVLTGKGNVFERDIYSEDLAADESRAMDKLVDEALSSNNISRLLAKVEESDQSSSEKSMAYELSLLRKVLEKQADLQEEMKQIKAERQLLLQQNAIQAETIKQLVGKSSASNRALHSGTTQNRQYRRAA